MALDPLTPEQQAVVAHPAGRHARVLAVAGSGKTTTLVYRIQHLVQAQNTAPNLIRVLMFNRLARLQFQQRMVQVGLPGVQQPKIHTFHSFCYHLINEMKRRRLLPGSLVFWLDDKEELIRIHLHRAIQNLERNKVLPPEQVDVDEAQQAIGLWKGSLIPPQRAGYHGNPYLPLVYAEFERLRAEQGAITYDDFTPLAVTVLESEPQARDLLCERVDHLIVDEYQDVNFGQQRLIELLAGQRADVMVVGDDDQTIYEWRGARPSYILSEFRTIFNNKPHTDYKLSHSFRFGPLLAQCAAQVISFNTRRVTKPLVAFQAGKPATIQVIERQPGQPNETNRLLTEQLVNLVQNQGVHPSRIIVLGRLYAQLSGLQSEFLQRGVPFRVLGQAPFFERREVRVLLNYIRLAQVLAEPVNDATHELLLSVANAPSRKLGRAELDQALRAAQLRRMPLIKLLERLVDASDSPFNYRQKDAITDLRLTLKELHRKLHLKHPPLIGELLSWLVGSLEFLAYFDDYYGKGEDSYDRKQAVLNFLGYARQQKLGPAEFLQHLASLDTTRQAPEAQQIVMTSVFRTKGLEYDYVFLPDCDEGFLPCPYESGARIYDKGHKAKEPEPSLAIENERRLFYVAITRARLGVWIGASGWCSPGTKTAKPPASSPADDGLPSRFLDEMQLGSTRGVMEALQSLFGQLLGEPHASLPEAQRTLLELSLLEQVKQVSGRQPLLQTLIQHYLASQPQLTRLAAEVQALSAGSPPEAFRYRCAYPSAAEASQRAERKIHQIWMDL